MTTTAGRVTWDDDASVGAWIAPRLGEFGPRVDGTDQVLTPEAMERRTTLLAERAKAAKKKPGTSI